MFGNLVLPPQGPQYPPWGQISPLKRLERPEIGHNAPHVIYRVCFDPKISILRRSVENLFFLVRNCPNASLNSGDNRSGLSFWIKLLARFSPGEHLCAILSKLSFSPLLPLTALHQGLNAAYTSWVPTLSSSPLKYQVFWPKKEHYLKCLSSFLQRICFDKCTGNLLFLVD